MLNRKKCSFCKKEKSLDCFSKASSKKDGLNTICKECSNAYHKLHYLKNKKDYISKAKAHRKKVVLWLKDYKAQLGCEICGENHPATLDFHHTNADEKEFNISQMVRRFSKERVLIEIAKCCVWCSNCHRKHHWEET